MFMNQINTIVFDLGGVLIDWKPEYVYRTIFSSEEEVQWFLKNITTSDWNEEQDAGKSLAEATEELIKKFPEHEINIRAFYDRWEEMLGGPIEETVQVFSDLKTSQKYRLYALTNWSAETFPVALQKYDFLHWFDDRLVSGEERTRKPFLDIYEKLIDKFSIDPSATVYIDDNKRNLFPAESLGMSVIHFESGKQLRNALQEMGLL